MSLSTRDAARLGLLVAVATTLQIAENFLPRPVPWLRLGLANAVTLLVLVRLGARAALTLTGIRVLLGGLLVGTFGGPGFLLSFTGGFAATLAMAVAFRAMPPFSMLGVSVFGSAAHVAAQLGTLGLIAGLGPAVFAWGPLFMACAVPVGLVTGALAFLLHRRLPAW